MIGFAFESKAPIVKAFVRYCRENVEKYKPATE